MIAGLIVVDGLAWYGYNFATSSVRTELAQQNVFFPPKGSATIDAFVGAGVMAMLVWLGPLHLAKLK